MPQFEDMRREWSYCSPAQHDPFKLLSPRRFPTSKTPVFRSYGGDGTGGYSPLTEHCHPFPPNLFGSDSLERRLMFKQAMLAVVLGVIGSHTPVFGEDWMPLLKDDALTEWRASGGGESFRAKA